MLLFFSACTKQPEIINTVNSQNAKAADESRISTTVYLINASNGVLYALNAKTGTVKWKHLESAYYYNEGVPCIKDSILYVKNQNNFQGLYIMAINAWNGKILWNKKLSERNDFDYSSPCISKDGIMYVASGPKLYAFDVDTRKVKWAWNAHGRRNRCSSPTFVNGSVYIADQNNIYSLNAATGTVKWQFPDNDLQVDPSSPTVHEGHVIYTNEYYVVSLDTNGIKQWSCNVPFFDGLKSVTYNNGIVYNSNGGETDTGTILKVFALNASNGTEIWSKTTVSNSTRHQPRSNVCFRNNVLYVPLYDTLLACDAKNGIVLWGSFTGIGQDDYLSLAEPCAMNNIVFVAGKDANLYAFDANNGRQLWAFKFSDVDYNNIHESPVILTADGNAIYPTVSGMVQ